MRVHYVEFHLDLVKEFEQKNDSKQRISRWYVTRHPVQQNLLGCVDPK